MYLIFMRKKKSFLHNFLGKKITLVSNWCTFPVLPMCKYDEYEMN